MHGHEHAEAGSDGGLGSPRKLIAIGLAAMAATIGTATATLPAPATTVELDGYRVELDGHAEAGVETTITYRLTRAGEPVDVEPCLGAAGHLVALREGDLAFLHVHPLAERLGEINFAATFPTAGQ